MNSFLLSFLKCTKCDTYSSSLTGYTHFSEDVDEATSILREFSTFLEQEDVYEKAMTVEPYLMRPSPFTNEDDTSLNGSMPELSNIYDKIVDLWVSCLPKQTPGPARLAKERIVRNIAMELHLSSLALFARKKSVLMPKLATPQPGADFVLPVRGKPSLLGHTESQGVQGSSVEPNSSMPKSTAAPNMTPDDTSMPSVPTEDPAISRLRGYTISIKSQPPPGTTRSAILAHWPSSPGADPSKYSWEATRTAVTDDEGLDSDEEEVTKWQKEEARRKKRAEKILRQQADTMGTASQPAPSIPFGSQPAMARPLLSTQPDDVVMTQPDRGVFGSRLGIKGSKKRRVRGF